MEPEIAIVHNIASQQSKTKKVKKQLNHKEKEKLWAIYDEEKQCRKKDTLDTIEQTDFCSKCHNLVIYSEGVSYLSKRSVWVYESI